MHATRSSDDWPEGLSVVAACVGDERGHCRSAPQEHGFEDDEAWTNAFAPEVSEDDVLEILGKHGSALFLLDGDGRVVHSGLLPATLLPALRDTFTKGTTR